MPQTERHVRLFRNGRYQAVRIPREFELEGEEAIMRNTCMAQDWPYERWTAKDVSKWYPPTMAGEVADWRHHREIDPHHLRRFTPRARSIHDKRSRVLRPMGRQGDSPPEVTVPTDGA